MHHQCALEGERERRTRWGEAEAHPRELSDELGVLDRHVLAVAAEDAHAAVLEEVDLGALAVVLVLAREVLALEPVEHLRDGLGRLGEHGLERDACERGTWRASAQARERRGRGRGGGGRTRGELARLLEVGDALLEQRRHDEVVARDLAASMPAHLVSLCSARERTSTTRQREADAREDALDDLGALLEHGRQLLARPPLAALGVLGRDGSVGERDEGLLRVGGGGGGEEEGEEGRGNRVSNMPFDDDDVRRQAREVEREWRERGRGDAPSSRRGRCGACPRASG